MKIVVDTERCEAHGDCVVAAPEVFDLDDEGNVVVLLQDQPGEELRDAVVEAARLCPVSAIRVED